MTTFKEIWRKLSSGRDYRKELVSSLLKRGTAMQIQALMKQRGWTQTQLAEHSGLTQGVISRASNPEYGNLTFNTVIDIAAGLDVAFVGRFVPFSAFAKWVRSVPQDMAFEMPGFEEENVKIEEVMKEPKAAATIKETVPKKQKELQSEQGKKEVERAVSTGAGKAVVVPAGVFDTEYQPIPQQPAGGIDAAAGRWQL